MNLSEKRYRIADVCFSINCRGDFTRRMCERYEINEQETAEFEISVSEEEISRENTTGAGEFQREYLESLAIYRKLCEKMLDYDTFLFHCSAVEVDGKAYLFAAPSGTGKSTHTRMWRKYFGDRAVMINDDKPLIQVNKEEIFVCGTPWSGKHRLDTNKKAMIEGICLLERGTENRIIKISPIEAYPGLYKQTYRPKEREKMKKTLELLKQFAERIPIYRMQCTISNEAAEVAWDAMKPKTNEGNLI